MGVYHITYIPKVKEICLFFNGGCNFSCHGCITDYYPNDCHLVEKEKKAPEHQSTRAPERKKEHQEEKENTKLKIEEVVSLLKPLDFKRVIFLGKEPIKDKDFLPLATILKQNFSTYHILLTNGYQLLKNTLIDEVCVGIKSISKKIFKDFTGQNNPEKVLNNLKKYVNAPYLKTRAESIFIPNYIDIDEIEKIAKYLS
ncbi:MAG: radical SAM protein, partial [bacterium]